MKSKLVRSQGHSYRITREIKDEDFIYFECNRCGTLAFLYIGRSRGPSALSRKYRGLTCEEVLIEQVMQS